MNAHSTAFEAEQPARPIAAAAALLAADQIAFALRRRLPPALTEV
jgi:hypothetical protein